jgi:transglutaminase-like putative cysteine protease
VNADVETAPGLASEIALAAVTGATVVSFVRLFQGASYLPPLLAVAAASHVAAAVARRRRWPTPLEAALVAVAALCTITGWRYRSGALLLVPTPKVLSHMGHDLSAAADAFRSVTAPAAPRPGFVLSLAALVALVAFGADGLAFRLRARAEAVVPAAGLFLFGAILGGSRLRLASTALFAASALVFVLVHRTAANRGSNHWIRGDTGRDTRGLLRAGSVIVVLTSLVGVTVATAAPHQSESPWTRWRGSGDDGGTRVTVSPLVDLRDRLTEQTNVLLFKVQASRPAYWRLTALDHLSDDTWSSNNSFSKASGGLDHPSPASQSTTLQQQYTLVRLAQVWAPAAFQATKIRGTDKLLYDAGSATLIVRRDQASSDGLTYDITSAIPTITSASLQQRGQSQLSADDMARYTQLPADFSPDVRAAAKAVVDDGRATTEYAKALALQNWFRANFVYSLNANYSRTPGSAIAAFLQQRQGWCEQFSGAYAAMARSLGLPTRIAVGFTPGRADPNAPGTFDVYGRQAHAWPEVWFPNEGWVAFEPTPGRGAPGAEQYTGVPYQQDDSGSGPPQTSGTIATRVDPGGGPVGTTTIPQIPSGASGTAGAPTRGTRTPASAKGNGSSSTVLTTVLLVVLVVGGLLALLIGALAGTRWWLRAQRRRTARTAADRVAVSWQEACDALTLMTAPPEPTETRLEFASRAGAAVPDTDEALGVLAGMTTEAVWDDGPPVRGTPERAAEIASQIDQTIKDELGRWRHAMATLDPRNVRDLARRR